MMQELQRLPQFIITKIESEDSIQFIGVFDSVLRLGEGWMGFLVGPDDSFIEGKFFSFDADTRTAVFRPKNSRQIELLKPGETYAYIDYYWGERVALVLDRSRHWSRETFTPKDAIEYTSGNMRMRGQVDKTSPFPAVEEGRRIEGGWEHEHCAICWEKIAGYAQPVGYTDKHGAWVCESCYSNYIKPRKPEFLNEVAFSQIIGTQPE